ncbi:hypothetical protein BC939DRAFT_434134 [Gamsiella multidivaricata]|uniref:uncharacterized protein n=1 Tax=Gamsiella multidivaricata TaxID=101098 RepID=UPI0022205897|nr:uncharacterized protein BC939DRAFT_434134 [Gamsiella multidivaricata]KAI7832714.1 hypothetical protein BC939DRAFT_434134 [Gamsiella multidivaricata]
MCLLTAQERYDEQKPPSYVRLDLCTSPCWPDLESITLWIWGSYYESEDHQILLETMPRLRKLDAPVNYPEYLIYQQLAQRYSSMLRGLNLRTLESPISLEELRELSWATHVQLSRLRALRALDRRYSDGIWESGVHFWKKECVLAYHIGHGTRPAGRTNRARENIITRISGYDQDGRDVDVDG